MGSHDQNRPSRRDVLRLGAAGAAGALAGGLGLSDPAAAMAAKLAAKGKKKPIGVGLQLYSVRRECGAEKGKGLIKVIEAVAKMGYEAVEFAGYYGWGAKDLKKLLDANGLTCCGTHTGLGALQGESFQRTVELHKTLGAKFIIVPGMPRQYTRTAEGWKKAAGVFNEIAAKLEPLGMYTGYHNHSHEFHKMGDTTPWDIFFGNTHERVVMQLDTGNCMGGKGDPVAIMRKYPGRQQTLHMKEHGGDAKTVVGEGTCPWKEIIRLARTTEPRPGYVPARAPERIELSDITDAVAGAALAQPNRAEYRNLEKMAQARHKWLSRYSLRDILTTSPSANQASPDAEHSPAQDDAEGETTPDTSRA